MLKLFYVEKINGDTRKAGYRVLNTDFISEVETYSSTKAKFQFMQKPDDRRGGKDEYIVSESRASIVVAMNRSFNAVALTLSAYQDNDATKTAVPTVFHAAEIIRAYPNTITDHTKSWIEYNHKGKMQKYLVNSYFVDIVDVAYTGSSTTTTSSSTSTTSTSTSSTSSTSTSSTSSTSTSSTSTSSTSTSSTSTSTTSTTTT